MAEVNNNLEKRYMARELLDSKWHMLFVQLSRRAFSAEADQWFQFASLLSLIHLQVGFILTKLYTNRMLDCHFSVQSKLK